jgi:hypothetical protein
VFGPDIIWAKSIEIGMWQKWEQQEEKTVWTSLNSILISQEFVSFGWITANSTIAFMSMMMRYGREEGFIVAVLFPGVGRLLWSIAFAFMILATTTQFGNGNL